LVEYAKIEAEVELEPTREEMQEDPDTGLYVPVDLPDGPKGTIKPKVFIPTLAAPVPFNIALKNPGLPPKLNLNPQDLAAPPTSPVGLPDLGPTVTAATQAVAAEVATLKPNLTAGKKTGKPAGLGAGLGSNSLKGPN